MPIIQLKIKFSDVMIVVFNVRWISIQFFANNFISIVIFISHTTVNHTRIAWQIW